MHRATLLGGPTRPALVGAAFASDGIMLVSTALENSDHAMLRDTPMPILKLLCVCAVIGYAAVIDAIRQRAAAEVLQ